MIRNRSIQLSVMQRGLRTQGSGMAVITSMTVFRWKKNTRFRMRYSEPMVFGYSLKGLKAWIR